MARLEGILKIVWLQPAAMGRDARSNSIALFQCFEVHFVLGPGSPDANLSHQLNTR